jgi:hypothetical protein
VRVRDITFEVGGLIIGDIAKPDTGVGSMARVVVVEERRQWQRQWQWQGRL